MNEQELEEQLLNEKDAYTRGALDALNYLELKADEKENLKDSVTLTELLKDLKNKFQEIRLNNVVRVRICDTSD